jgi:hypothetical protein
MLTRYEIVVAGRASPMVTAAFDEFAISSLGNGRLRMVGNVRDDAGLHGVLHRIQSLGMAIIEVRRLEGEHEPE